MKKTMPQEIEVWYLIPALRRELSKILVKEHNLTQRKVAEILGVTEAAVSQYMKSKRGKEVKFSKTDLVQIKKAAQCITKKNKDCVESIYDLCIYFRGSKLLCDLHRKRDKNIASGCNACFG
jgi:uncharacterized protein